MTETDYDLITIGGGIAASALAKVMAEAGQRVLIVERETTFRDRVRGEWLAPWGVAETQQLGVYEALKEAGAHELPKMELRLGPPGEPRDFPSTKSAPMCNGSSAPGKGTSPSNRPSGSNTLQR